jgi:hypothetical protein
VRNRLIAVAAVGVLGVSGLAVAMPALGASPGAQDGEVRTSRIEKVKEALAGLVTDRTLTQDQADKVATTLADTRGMGGFGHGPRGGRGGMDLAVAAKTLKLGEDDLREAMRSGDSLAAVAKKQDVTVQVLVDALVKAAKDRQAEDVKEGRLTQEQADQHAGDLTERVTAWVNGTHEGRGMWRGDGSRGDQPPANGGTTTAQPETSAKS